MGQFSWIYSDTDRQMVDGKKHNSYLLVPPEFVKEFGSHHIEESCYNGYGDIGGYDVYDLIVYWNKDWILNNPKLVTHNKTNPLEKLEWFEYIQQAKDINNFKDFKEFIDEECGYPLRYIGIDIACYDVDNEQLENPIKIVENENLIYNQLYASKTDSNQGWSTYDYTYLEDITGTIGEWLDRDTSEFPEEVVILLERVYNLCINEY